MTICKYAILWIIFRYRYTWNTASCKVWIRNIFHWGFDVTLSNLKITNAVSRCVWTWFICICSHWRNVYINPHCTVSLLLDELVSLLEVDELFVFVSPHLCVFKKLHGTLINWINVESETPKIFVTLRNKTPKWNVHESTSECRYWSLRYTVKSL